jgi:hypothetical protein
MKYLIVLLMLFTSTEIFAQEWVPYQPYPITVVQPNINYYPVPTVQQPVIVYQWVPYSVQQNIIVDQYCLFRRTQTVVSRPTVQWIYQPVVIYR